MAVVLLLGAAVTGCSGNGSEPSASSSAGSAPAAATSSAPAESTAASPETQGEIGSLKTFVAGSSATPEMKSAVANDVTKVDASDGQVDIYTDLNGDLGSSDSGAGKLIVSAATDWAKQEHEPISEGAGLITVYNANGDILSNGNY